MSAVQLSTKGADFVRIVRCLAATRGSPSQAAGFAEARYGFHSGVTQALKSASAAGGVSIGSDGTWGEALGAYVQAATEWMEAVAEASVLGRMGALRVPPRVRVAVEGSGEAGTWITESGPIPVESLAIDAGFAELHRVGSIIVLTEELARSNDPRADTIVRRRLLRSFVQVRDRQFLTTGAVTPGAPDPATSGAVSITSSGNPHEDVQALVEAFEGDLQTASLVTDPRTVAAMALWRDAGGASAFPRLSVRTGGDAIGIPVIASRASPWSGSDGGQLALIDGAGILVAEEPPAIDIAKNATVQMNTTPDDPQTASTVLVSLWQENLQAIRGIQYVSWHVARGGSVVIVEGARYQ